MVSLLVHAVLGVAVVVWIVRANPAIFRRTASGPLLSGWELSFYVVGAVSVVLGWWFNIEFVRDYAPSGLVANPIWGDGSWTQYIQLMFDNPASSSAGQDYTIGNVVLLPLMTILHGSRLGIRRPWLFFVASLFTSFVLAWALYLATVERQRRLQLEEGATGRAVPATSAG
jgi:hypothetical protein